MKTVKKFNYYRFTMCILVLGCIIFGITKYVNNKKYTESLEYKLLEHGYSEEEITTLNSKLEESQVKELLNIDYDKNILTFINEKYFLYNNLTSYLEYKKENKNTDSSKIVAIINTEANIEWLDEEKETDLSKNELMLVNRLYSLGEYEPEDIVDVPVQYAYSGIQISESILDIIISMIEEAKTEGYNFIISSGYRSYETQEKLYDSYARSYGSNEADNTVARPGHSEYQTGLTFDLSVYGKELENATESDEYLWLTNNLRRYGFIVRYTEDKEYITGFNASPWRIRYVGEDAAQTMYNEGICFDEYYAYFIRGKNEQ